MLAGKAKRDTAARGRGRPRPARARPRGELHAIVGVEPRTALLERRVPEGRGTRPVAANVDQVFVVTATVDPAPIPQLIDRLLVVAEANEIPAAVVVNKVDLDPGTGLIERCRRAGYAVYPTSVRTGEGMAEFAAALAGRISVVTGPSGAGKSSLLNRVQPGLQLRTGEISAKVRRGKNTTVSAVMLPLDAGGYLVDTPGFSEVGLWGIDPGELDSCFPEFRPFLGQCRYGDCRHRTEPGCRVREARRGGRDRARPVGELPGAAGGAGERAGGVGVRAGRTSGQAARAYVPVSHRSGQASGPGRALSLVLGCAPALAPHAAHRLPASSSTDPGPASPPSPSSARTRPRRSMPSRLAMQISTNRMSAISMAEIALGLVRLLGLLAEAVVDLARELADLLGEPRQVGERVEVALLVLADPGVHPALRIGERHANAVAAAGAAGTASARRAASARISARMNCGRSAGVRDEIRFPSTTTGLSSHSRPAFTRSSLIAPTLVPALPADDAGRDRDPPRVADERDRLVRFVDLAGELQQLFRPPHDVGRVPARNDQAVELARRRGRRRSRPP